MDFRIGLAGKKKKKKKTLLIPRQFGKFPLSPRFAVANPEYHEVLLLILKTTFPHHLGGSY